MTVSDRMTSAPCVRGLIAADAGRFHFVDPVREAP